MNKPRYGAKENAMTQIPEEPPNPLPSNSQTGKHHRPFPRRVSVHLERKPASIALIRVSKTTPNSLPLKVLPATD